VRWEKIAGRREAGGEHRRHIGRRLFNSALIFAPRFAIVRLNESKR
jgi:hypothetical protein